ncbi:hypothetical protein DMUE_4612 [Dictyocoela muelleri]|nr:hypothetical protein DMUE_4612 [Dictyocoela muelleri]
MYRIINCTEETVLDQTREKIHVPKNKSKPQMPKEAIRKNENYCSHHGSCNHNSKECRYLRSRNEQNSADSKKNNFALRELNSKIQTLNLIACIENVQHKAILDTESTYSYIGNKIAKTHKAEVKTINYSEALLANGETIKTNKETTLKFFLENEKNTIYSNKLKIINKMDDFMILGMDFLLKNKVKIDLESKIIKINEIELEIPGCEPSDDCENRLDMQNKIYHMTTLSEHKDILDLIYKNERIQPIGSIEGISHSITLTKNFIINKPPIGYL